MENRNGQGIFYGVIGVATLVVAIIGATFAFFSASASSAANAISASGANISLTYTDVKTGVKANLIPVDSSLTRFPSVVGITADKCKDDNGNNICSALQFTVGNPAGNAAQSLFGKLIVEYNNFSYGQASGCTTGSVGSDTHLHFAIFKGAMTSNGSYNVLETATATGTATDGHVVVGNTALPYVCGSTTQEIALTNLNQVMNANTSATYTVVVWLEEVGEQNIDQGRLFSASVRFDTGSGTGGVTGVLSGNSGGN
jgi:hypothetical protein